MSDGYVKAPQRIEPTTEQLLAPVAPRRNGRAQAALSAVLRSTAVAIWLPILLFAIWWLVSANSTSPFFPPLSSILERWWEEFIVGDASRHVFASLQNFAMGFALGAIIGIVCGTLLWRFRAVRQAGNPIIYFLYVLPAPALLPAMIAIFGIGQARQVALIAFGAIWPTLLNTLDGMRGIDQVKFDTAKAMRLRGARTLFSLVFPAASPQIAAGLRASLQASLILMVVSEMVAAKQGIGYFILQAQIVFSSLNVWAGIIMLVIIGTILNYLFVFIEHRVLSWYYRSRALGNS
jgi:ABC-type nitrate/sulfonate/bicarbonate transport system permease component